MNESKEFEKLSALAEVGDAHAIDVKRSTIAAVRVSPGSYLALASVLTFVSALLLRAEYSAVALGLVMLALDCHSASGILRSHSVRRLNYSSPGSGFLNPSRSVWLSETTSRR
jgi:hypothetical protein